MDGRGRLSRDGRLPAPGDGPSSIVPDHGPSRARAPHRARLAHRRAPLAALVLALAGAALAVGGYVAGRDSMPSRPPATLAQAIEEASAGQLPLGGDTARPSQDPAVRSVAPTSTPPQDALPTLTFKGEVRSVSAGSLVVQTQAGPVTVALSGATRYSTVGSAPRAASGLGVGRSVVVVPATPAPGRAPDSAAVVVVLPWG